MAPTRSKKRKSDESTTSLDLQNFPAPPQLIPTKTRSPARTPINRSPTRKPKMRITLAQKQALIDNLQLEITERARKLRAQYMLQAQGLRTRIEIRVNRIPVALRREKMGDLLLKSSGNVSKAATTTTTSPVKVKTSTRNLMPEHSHTRTSPSPQPRMKRHSEQMAVDKENEDIENPKKRARGPVPAERTVSRNKVQASQVLSPRSANSRTLPGSPIRPTTPGNTYLTRPVSPLKPLPPAPPGGAASILTSMVEKAKAGRGAAATRKKVETPAAAGGVGRGRRTAAPAAPPKVARGRAISNSSDGSNATIVRKPVPITKKAAPAPRKTVMSTIKGMGGGTKKAPATKAPAVGRVLRKRD